ncbi:LysR family transcriptional regulator [Pectobacterium brasiliense]|uniref:LysR family transcriptional regulator n=1 Tax=Pectobacterium TaxID=122277 RepID=UPI00057F7621|nr:LysR family transcriptional regulator [Pectobacterium brasiliense]KHS64919.1 LysR family transcriptional regulator [Pectobacterium brasiliense]
MNKIDLADLNSFVTLAEELSFTRASVRLETSQSALSHAVKRFETRLGVRLFTRSTRQVTLTQAGEQLYKTLYPAFESIAMGLNEVGALREKPAGSIRLTAPPYAARKILFPVIRKFNEDYPDVKFDLSVDSGFRDIISERFDAGVRLGELVASNMVAVRISPDMRMSVVASLNYIERNGLPKHPTELADHNCINFRLPTNGGNYIWEFNDGKKEINVRVDGKLTFNDSDLIIEAVVHGVGIACLTEVQADELVKAGKLVRMLEEWCQSFPGYHIFYQERKNNSAAFKLFVERLKMNNQ